MRCFQQQSEPFPFLPSPRWIAAALPPPPSPAVHVPIYREYYNQPAGIQNKFGRPLGFQGKSVSHWTPSDRYLHDGRHTSTLRDLAVHLCQPQNVDQHKALWLYLGDFILNETVPITPSKLKLFGKVAKIWLDTTLKCLHKVMATLIAMFFSTKHHRWPRYKRFTAPFKVKDPAKYALGSSPALWPTTALIWRPAPCKRSRSTMQNTKSIICCSKTDSGRFSADSKICRSGTSCGCSLKICWSSVKVARASGNLSKVLAESRLQTKKIYVDMLCMHISIDLAAS